MKRSVNVTVAGQRLSIRTDAKKKYVNDLAAYVTERIGEVKRGGRSASTQQQTLLAAMNMADELFQLREEQERLKQTIRDTSRRVLRYLDQQLDG